MEPLCRGLDNLYRLRFDDCRPGMSIMAWQADNISDSSFQQTIQLPGGRASIAKQLTEGSWQSNVAVL